MKSVVSSVLAVLCTTILSHSASGAETTLVSRSDTWRFNKGSSPYQTNWKTVADSGLGASWLSGPGGFGYGDGDDVTVLSDMSTSYSTIYIRKTFTIASAVETNQQLILVMDWDDGFVAWLDGVELKRDRAPGTIGVEPPVGARATSTHEAQAGGGAAPTTFDLGPVMGRLGPGEHVLAIMGLNESTNSSDMTLIADLKLREAVAPPIVAHGDNWRYFKGTSAPVANWKTVADAALDGSWLTGPGGFGYGDGDDATILADMLNTYSTIYIRKTFNVPAPLATNLQVMLTMDWDDGFVAYLDGVEVKRETAPGTPGTEPAHTDVATGLHEAGTPVTYTLGAASALLPPGNHILAIIGLNETLDSSDVSLIADLSVGVPPPPPAGSITEDTTWTAANSPYVISNSVTVASGVTLTIEPGVTVLFNQGLGMTINGRLLAEASPENRIVFTRSGTSGSWDQIYFGASSSTSRLAHVEMAYFAGSALEAHDTTLYLDTISWTNSTAPAVDLHNSSITLLNSYIAGGAGNEPVHFSGMPSGGHALIKNCVFGAPRGYNDSIDFTGGNRPGPIVQFIDNVFLGGVDDCFDMDATDAHIEGNIFMNVLQDDERESSSHPIATGEGNGASELFIARNIFFNCEHTLLLKDGGSAVMQNNTIVHLVTNALARTAAAPGGQAIPPGIILFGEPWRSGRTPGVGVIYEGNIAYDLHPIIQGTPFPLYDPAESFLIASHSLIQGNDWPGEGNISSDPLFANLTGPMTAANIRSNLALLTGSPAIGTGPNGLDMGANVPAGASISGAPTEPTTNSNVTLRIAGPGVVAYKWKLDNGPWSSEIALTNSFLITPTLFDSTNGLVHLSGLSDGAHTVYAIGKNSAGAWQETNHAAAATWTVQSSAPLEITDASRDGGIVTLKFIAEAGKTYTVQYRDALDDTHPWIKLTDIPAQASTGVYQVEDLNANSSSTRFYRLVRPAQP